MEQREKLYVNADELSRMMEISRGHAYKIIRQLNDELAEKGFIVVAGKVSRRYMEERCYGICEVRHKGGIAHTEILFPETAPSEYADRAVLWNAVEKIEKAKNAQLAREIELALPVELSLEQNTDLVRAYCRQYFVNVGMCADICIHDKQDGNPHAHVMLTMRPFNDDATWGTKQKKEYIPDANLKERVANPIRQWKKEAAELGAGRAAMYAEYTHLRGETQNAESILHCMERVLREEPMLLPQKKEAELSYQE